MASQRSQDLQQKAEEFWNEIKDLKVPDVTTGKTTDQIIEDILEHEKVKTGIDWKSAAAGGDKEWKAATDKAHSHLNGLKSKLSHGEIERAKQMGILNVDGELPSIMELFADTEPATASIPDGATPYTVWGWKPEHAKKFQDAKGDEIKARILNLVRNFQVMAKSDARWMVKLFAECGLWAVGYVGLVKVWEIMFQIGELTEATEAFAVLEGILEVGSAVITLGISLVILAILVPLFLMLKDAAGLMVIVNDTNQDLDLEDITCTYGKVIGIFKENPALENPKPIIPKKLPPVINPVTKKIVAEGSIQAGFLAVRKRDYDPDNGTQGALKFKATESFPQGAYIGWSVPLTSIGGMNALLVSATYNESLSQFSDNTDEKGKQEDTSTSTTNAKITGRVNSGSGSQAFYIMNLSAE